MTARTIKIPLSQGLFATVDEIDGWALKYKWYAHRGGDTFYAERMVTVGGRRITIKLHREILRAQPGQCVDHANGDGTDNRRKNIRICNFFENNYNRGSARGSSSKFKGVAFHSRDRKWEAYIKINKRRIHLGSFDSEEEAALAYDLMAKKVHGSFAKFNVLTP